MLYLFIDIVKLMILLWVLVQKEKTAPVIIFELFQDILTNFCTFTYSFLCSFDILMIKICSMNSLNQPYDFVTSLNNKDTISGTRSLFLNEDNTFCFLKKMDFGDGSRHPSGFP